MKIDFVTVKDSEPSGSPDSDFKDVLTKVKVEKKSIKAVKQISATNKYERKKKKPKILKGFIISPILDMLFNGDKRARYEAKMRDKSKIIPIDNVEELPFINVTLQQVIGSISYTFYLDNNDGTYRTENKKTRRNEYGIANFFVQRANQEKMMLNSNYINTKTSRDYQVYFKGRRYFFNIDENDVLSRAEDKDDGA